MTAHLLRPFRFRTARLPSLLLLAVLLAGPALAQFDDDDDEDERAVKVTALDLADYAMLDTQRAMANELARRHVGPSFRKDPDSDLNVLQRLVDAKILGRHQRRELQALGVAFGDLMADELDLEWVVVRDRYGRSRALRFRDTENIVFPTTMISKRYEADVEVDVAGLYEKVRQDVAGWIEDVTPSVRKNFFRPWKPTIER